MSRIIGLTGVAKSGKDTFCEYLIDYFFYKKGFAAKRYAMADKLKESLNPFAEKEFGVDLFNCGDKEKEFIRPLMVVYGCLHRQKSDGRYWVDFVLKQIEQENPLVAIITDIRFAETEHDEYFAIKDAGASIIHITRILPNFGELQAPNDEERRNDPILKELADFKFVWPTLGKGSEKARKMVYDFADLCLKELKEL